MKPSLNRIIYIIYEDEIHKTKVYMLGEKEFCHEEAFNSLYEEDYRWPLSYEEYNETWFTSLTKAKKYLKEQLYPDYPKAKILQIEDDFWVLAKNEGEVDYWKERNE